MVKKVSQKCISSFLDNMSILSFYEQAAAECGLKVTKNSVFNCTRVQISMDILEKWKREFAIMYGKENLVQLMQHLCLYGPKAVRDLNGNEVEILKGFISEEGHTEI